VLINPINAASESVRGIDLKATARWDAGRYGRFSTRLAYSLVIDHEYRQFGENLSVGVIVNNLRDSRPPAAKNGGGWPFYPVGNYDPYGRQYWVQLDYRFR